MKYKIDLITREELIEAGLIDQNVYEEYCKTSIDLAQEMGLQPIIGSILYEKLRNEETLSISDELKEELLDMIKHYLLYQTTSELILLNTLKIRQAGTIYAQDVNYSTFSINDLEHITQYFYDKARFFGNRLSSWLISHNVPEYKEQECGKLAADPLSYRIPLNLNRPKQCNKCTK